MESYQPEKNLVEHLSLRDWISQWLKVKHISRPSSFEHYHYRLKHLPREWLDRPVQSLKPVELLEFFHDLPVGRRTQHHIHSVLRGCLADAVREGVIDVSPMRHVPAPFVPYVERPVLTPPQVRMLISECFDRMVGPLVITAVLTGMREGELLALQWDKVDLDRGSIQVSQSLREHHGALVFGPCKTRKSHRELAISPWLCAVLRQHQRRVDIQAMGPRWTDHNLVFPSAYGMPLRRQNLLRREFYPLLDSLGLPRIHFHDLRHTAGYLMKRGRAPLGDIKSAMGHSTIRTTEDIYGHTFAEDLRDLAAGVDAVLGLA